MYWKYTTLASGPRAKTKIVDASLEYGITKITPRTLKTKKQDGDKLFGEELIPRH
jgi:hypothetical protein